MGFNGPVDLNFPALQFIMDILGVQDRETVVKRVYSAYNAGLEIIRKHSE